MGLRFCKIFDKNLPQFGIFAFVMRLQKFCQKFCPSLKYLILIFENLRGSCPTVNARKMLRVLFFQSRFKTTKSTLLLLFSKASKLGFDSLCLCRVNVLSENVLISSMKLLTMLFKQKLPQFKQIERMLGLEFIF